MMKSKPEFLLLLVFLLFHQASPVADVVLSEVESWVVTRRANGMDLFRVNMKTSYRCLTEWCQYKFSAAYHSVIGDYVSCLCTCSKPTLPTFIPLMQKCVNSTVAANFGECRGQGYFNNQNLPVPVDLSQASTKEFSVSDARSCILGQDYFVYDYSGFQCRWLTIINSGFFVLSMRNNANSFNITWKAKKDLSGRIIRLDVTCSKGSASSTSCILLKAKGPVTYSATPASSLTITGHTFVSNPPIPCHVTMLSATSSLMTKSSSSLSLPLSLTVSPSSSSLSQTSSASLPPSTTDRLSSTPPSSSFAYQPPSSSLSSPSPSLVLTSSSGTLGVLQSDSSFLPLTQSQTARLPVITTGQIQATTNAVIVTIEPAETTTAMSSSSAADGGPGKRGTQTGGNDNGVVIGAAVGGAVVLGILLIIFIAFWKRRKAWESTEKQTKPVKNPLYGSSENAIQLEAPKGSKTVPSIAQGSQPTYQSLVDDNGKRNEAAIYSSADNEYDNCTVYQSLDKQIPGTPVYGRLNKGLPEPAHTTGLPKPKPKAKTSVAGKPTSEANGVTGLPKPKPATTTGKPTTVAQENVYNVLDGPGTGQGTTPEPLYNLLEGTDNPAYEQTLAFDAPYAALHRPGMQRESGIDPLYNVLEGPEASHDAYGSGEHTAQEPLYNVLDGPDAEKSPMVTQGTAGPSNEPLYNVLDGPDSDGSKQGAPKKPNSPEAHDNPAYEQTLAFDAPYAAVHSPGMQRESVYEPLRGPGQDLYESIGRSDNPNSAC